MNRIRRPFDPRFLWLAGILLVLACDASNISALFAPTAPPAGTTIVAGGIASSQPFFGKLRDARGDEVGDALLATCGCGFWRVLAQMSDGSQFQLTVQYYATSPYVPTGMVEVFGNEDGRTISGTVDQDAGVFDGDLYARDGIKTIRAQRGNSHEQAIQACVLCHVGDDPLFPRPPTHPPYVPGQTDCFTCHTVTIQ